MSTDAPSGDGSDSDSGSKKGGGGDHEGTPVCPRCKEPFADTLSAISKLSTLLACRVVTLVTRYSHHPIH